MFAQSSGNAVVGVMHGKINFFLHNFDLLNFSQPKDQCISIKSPKYF